nr:PREDICTED: uncharacterized protein LOC109033104 [Bemisia tabaci]
MVLYGLILVLATVLMLLTVGLAHAKNGTSLSCDFSRNKAVQPIFDQSENSREINTGRAVANAYYDFLINEGSYKFWAIFQLATVAILLYSVFAAIYYAKYQYLTDPPTDIDDLFRSNNGGLGTLDESTFLMILQALEHVPLRD